MARDMKGLDSFVHVSTAYAHCHLQNEVLQEKGRTSQLIKFTITLSKYTEGCLAFTVYPPEVYSTKEVLNMNRYSDVDSEHLTRLTVGERPNTYTFTKAIAEQLINEERGSLPISIVRPSIVAGAIAEPMPGWVDNVNGPMGLVLSGAHGLCRSAFSRIGLILRT